MSEQSGEKAHPVDLSKPMALRAEMARQGLMFNQLLPYEDPERGHVDPLNDPEMKAAVRRFMGRIWQAALRAERADIASSEQVDR